MADPRPEVVGRIWRQDQLPVVFRPRKKAPLAVKLPYRSDNREWLRGDATRKPRWVAEGKHWTVPRTHYQRVVELCIERFGALYVIEPFRESSEVCAPACWNAVGPDCSCSCAGMNHGIDVSAEKRWHIVGDALAVSWGREKLRCLLLIPGSERRLEDDATRLASGQMSIIREYIERDAALAARIDRDRERIAAL